MSINTHADETRMLPGHPGCRRAAASPTATSSRPQACESPDRLAGALVFLIGCHAGNNLPAAYYGDVRRLGRRVLDAAGYVGNTGYGLANNVTTALGERLLALYADWIGVETAGGKVSASRAPSPTRSSRTSAASASTRATTRRS